MAHMNPLGKVVTICTAQWSLYAPHSGHYLPHSGRCMYRTMVAVCTAQWSLYVPHSGHYMNCTVFTVCTAQWLLYVPTGLTFTNSTFCPHSVFMCFVWIWERTAIISLYSINWLVFITETECVYCAVRTGSLCIAVSCYSSERRKNVSANQCIVLCFTAVLALGVVRLLANKWTVEKRQFSRVVAAERRASFDFLG